MCKGVNKLDRPVCAISSIPYQAEKELCGSHHNLRLFMSVVAGCSLFDGVLLSADCRATIKLPKHPDIHSDNVLKIIAILPHTAIGFAGDIHPASYLIQSLLAELKNKKRKDPISLANWIPRLFRYRFKKYVTHHGHCIVNFMIASVLRDRPNIVKRKEIFELIKTIGFGNSPIKRNWIPSLLFNLLEKSGEKDEWIEVPNTCRNILYTLYSPTFRKHNIPILKFTAIGTGKSCIEEIQRYYDVIFSWQPGNHGQEAMWLRSTIQQFIEEKNINDVGGLYPVIKLTGKRDPQHIGLSTEVPIGGTKIELIFNPDSYQWKQKNITTGKEIPITMPWDYLKSIKQQIKNNTFNDLNDAYRDFRGEVH